MIDYLTISNIVSFVKVFLDVTIVAFLIYYCLRIVRNNKRTIQIFKGIVLILIADALAKLFGLETVEWLTTQFINWGFLAIIIVFQPEIRSLLEKMGRSSAFNSMNALSTVAKEQLVNELVKTADSLSATKTGAIISIEQAQSLEDYISTGTKIDSEVSCELLSSIFYTGTALHDGAVIIRGNRVACASAYFPPTSKSLPTLYGARHRAAVGISEISDCITIVVSEETGRISIAQNGGLTVYTPEELREFLMRNITNSKEKAKYDQEAYQSYAHKNDSTEILSIDKDELIEAKEIVIKETNKGGEE